MRTKNSIYNSLGNVLILLVQTVLAFIVRITFLKALGKELLGVHSLFTNIITMLSLADLGISSAISFSLYKPLSDKDYEKIGIIMTLLKKIYIVIGTIVLLLGICICPFIKYIISGYSDSNIIKYFLLFFISYVIEYFLAYPEILITADQKKYKISWIYIVSNIFTCLIQILILKVTKSFSLYLLIDLLFRLIKFVYINLYVKSKYKKVNFSSEGKLKKTEKKGIVTNVKSLFYLRVGDYLINGTDNLLISKIINIGTVGIYTNYLSIVSIVKNILLMALNGITSSYGNLIVKEDKKVQINVFNIINFITFAASGLLFIGMYFLFNIFIQIVFGESYLLSSKIVFIICINFYLVSLLMPVEMVKNAAGLYKEDKFVSLIQAAINIVLSIVLGIKYGLIGILGASTISYLLVTVWERPFIVYKKLFKEKVTDYYFDYLKKAFLLLFIFIVCGFFIRYIHLNTLLVELIVKGIIITLIYLLFIVLIYRNSTEFKYVFSLLKKNEVKNEKNNTN